MFEALVPEPLSVAANTLLASDDFNSCADDGPPNSSLWETVGSPWYCKSSRLRGEVANGAAWVGDQPASNAEVSSLVQLNTNANNSGVIARLSAGAYYKARLDEVNDRVVIERIDQWGTVELAAASYSIAINTSYTLTLRTIGWNPVQLEAYIGSTLVTYGFDESSRRLWEGSSGLFSATSSRTQFDNFTLTSK